MAKGLNRAEVKAFYDRFGRRQDRQGWYEDAAIDDLIAHGGFESAATVFELGCGTGRLAARLLDRHLPADAHYLGVDLSDTMISIARARLAPWEPRAVVRPGDGGPAAGAYDRFVATYVLDLMAAADIDAVLDEAHRLLGPAGRLCLAGLAPGERGLARVVTWAWRRAYALRPQWVGGCRPIRIADHMAAQRWQIRHRRVVSRFGITSEVIVATPLK